MHMTAALTLTAAALFNVDSATAQTSGAASDCRIFQQSSCPNAVLHGLDLKGQLMAMMDLTGADLTNANLEAADLWKADLAGANLSGANLTESFLTGANLRGANLSGADLRKAFIFGAFTEGANFADARLDGARWITGAICGPGSIGQCHPLPADAPVKAPMQYGPPGGVYAGGKNPITVPASVPAAPSPTVGPPTAPSAAPAAAAASAPSPPAPRPTGSVRLQNDAVGTVTQVLPADVTKAKRTNGASFLGTAFMPKSAQSILHVKVTANAYSAQDNVVVVAVFRDNEERPLTIATAPVAANQIAVIELEFEVPARRASPIDLDFRIGPARPGLIIVNGPGDEPRTDVPHPSVTITD